MGDQARKSGQPPLVFKPYQRGTLLSGLAVKRGLRLLIYYGVFVLVHLALGNILQTDNAVFRVAANGLLLAGEAGILFLDGAKLGETETARGEIAHQRAQAGKPVDRADLDRCFHPGKGWIIALAAAVPLLLVCVFYALTAKKQVYSLQALPDWVAAYEGHEEIAQGLQYYAQPQPFSGLDILRIAVRLLIFPFVCLAGADSAALLALDRLSPLLACVPLLGYPLGYRTGPRARAQVHGSIRASARRKKRREKKAVQARHAPAAGKKEII